MPTPTWDDLNAFLDINDFAVIAIRDDASRFPVILEEQYLSHELGTYDMDTATPWAVAKEADTHGLKKRNCLTIAGIRFWLVHDPQPDGTGMSTLQLSRSSP